MRDDRHKGMPQGIWWAMGGLIFLFIVGSIASFYFFRAKARKVITAQAGGLSAGVAALQNFDFAGAARAFNEVASNTAGFQAAAGRFPYSRTVKMSWVRSRTLRKS